MLVIDEAYIVLLPGEEARASLFGTGESVRECHCAAERLSKGIWARGATAGLCGLLQPPFAMPDYKKVKR